MDASKITFITPRSRFKKFFLRRTRAKIFSCSALHYNVCAKKRILKILTQFFVRGARKNFFRAPRADNFFTPGSINFFLRRA